jgi:hypothetical protein
VVLHLGVGWLVEDGKIGIRLRERRAKTLESGRRIVPECADARMHGLRFRKVVANGS